MFRSAPKCFVRFDLLVLLLTSILICAGLAQAQETGGELGGGAGIFRPKNPEAKRSSNPSRSGPRSTRANPAEVEEKFEDAIADGNDARDARKFAAAESSYRAALRLKPRDSRAFYGLGNVFVDQQRWDDAEDAYRKAVEFAPNSPESLVALSFALVQPRTGAVNAKRFADAEFFARRATQLQPTNAVAFDRLGRRRTAGVMARGAGRRSCKTARRRARTLDRVVRFDRARPQPPETAARHAEA